MTSQRTTPAARRLAELNRILVEDIPRSVQLACLPFEWDREALYAMQTPTRQQTVRVLDWHFDVPFWADGGRPFQVTPNDVLADPVRYADQYRRTVAADLGYPLTVVWWRRRWTIVDGVHRLLKARIIGLGQVEVREVALMDVPTVERNR